MAAFSQTAISELYGQLLAAGQQSGIFKQVIAHEPRTAPQADPVLAVWLASLTPVRGVSGLAETAGRCQFAGRIYISLLAKPEDATDPALLYAASQLLAAWSAGFTLGGDVMEIDLLGAYGTPLGMEIGYIVHDEKPFRIAEITVPLVIDGLWVQAP